MPRVSDRVRRAQEIRRSRHQIGRIKYEDMDEDSVNISATTTIICIFFLLSVGATIGSWYHISACLGDGTTSASSVLDGWLPHELHTALLQNMTKTA